MINKDVITFRLIQYGVNGRLYSAIQSLYNDPITCVRIHGYCTNWCSTSPKDERWVKQGNALSPILFAIYRNDLAKEIKAN